MRIGYVIIAIEGYLLIRIILLLRLELYVIPRTVLMKGSTRKGRDNYMFQEF